MQCNSIHKTIVDNFKHAIVYGKSCKHQPQRVGLSHELADEDIGTYPSIIPLNGYRELTNRPVTIVKR